MTSAPTWWSIRRSTVASTRHYNIASMMLCWMLLFCKPPTTMAASLSLDPQQPSYTHLEEQRNDDETSTPQQQHAEAKSTEMNQNVLFQVQASVTVTLSNDDDGGDYDNTNFVDFDPRPWMDDSKSFILTIDEVLEEGGNGGDDTTKPQGTNDPFQMEQPLKLSWEILNNTTLSSSASTIILKGEATLSMLFPLEDATTTTLGGSQAAADRTLIVTLWEDDVDTDDDVELLPPTMLTRRLANLPKKVLEFKTRQSKLVPVELHASGPFVKVQLDTFTTYSLPHFLENKKGGFHHGKQTQSEAGGAWSWTLYGCTALASWIWFWVSQRKSASAIQNNTGEAREPLDGSVGDEGNKRDHVDEQEECSVEDEDPHALAEKDQLSYEGDSSGSSDCGSACKIDRPPKVVRDSPHTIIPKDLAFLSRPDGTPSSNSKRAIWKCDQNKDNSKFSKRASKLPPKEIFADMESNTVGETTMPVVGQSKKVPPSSGAKYTAKMPAHSSATRVTAPVDGNVFEETTRAQASPPVVIARKDEKMLPTSMDSGSTETDEDHKAKTNPAEHTEAKTVESKREPRVTKSRAVFDNGCLASTASTEGTNCRPRCLLNSESCFLTHLLCLFFIIIITTDCANATGEAGIIGAPSKVHDDHTNDLSRLNLTSLEAPEKADKQGANDPPQEEKAASTTGIGELPVVAKHDKQEQTSLVMSDKRGRNTHVGDMENNNWLRRLKKRGNIHIDDKAVSEGKSSQEEDHPSHQKDDAATNPFVSALPVGNESSESDGSQDLGAQKKYNRNLSFASANVETGSAKEEDDDFAYPDSSDSPTGKPEGRVTPSTDGSRKRLSSSQSDTIDTAGTAISDVVSRVAKKRRKRRRISLDTADKLLLPGVGPSKSLKWAAENVMSQSWNSGRRRSKSKSKASSKSA